MHLFLVRKVIMISGSRDFFDKYIVADEFSAVILNRLASESNACQIVVQKSSQDESGPGAMRSLSTWSCRRLFVCIFFSSDQYWRHNLCLTWNEMYPCQSVSK